MSEEKKLSPEAQKPVEAQNVEATKAESPIVAAKPDEAITAKPSEVAAAEPDATKPHEAAIAMPDETVAASAPEPQPVLRESSPSEPGEAVVDLPPKPSAPLSPPEVLPAAMQHNDAPPVELTKDEEAPGVDEQRAIADAAVLAESRRRTRRSFIGASVAAAAGYGFYRWIDRSPGVGMQRFPLRDAFRTNAAISRAVSGDRALAPTYPLKAAKDLRVNGVFGLKKMLAPQGWRLQLVGMRDATSHPRFTTDVTSWEYQYMAEASHEDQGHDTKVDPNARTAEKMAPKPMLGEAKAAEESTGRRMPRGKEEAGESRSTLMPGTPGLLLTMEDILKLPRHELVTQFKCIEGWSEIVHWAGVRMADFLEAYPPALIDGKEPKYVYMETPDGDYYTGYDLDVCRHPQTLLVTEMMGAPLTQFHGAPLRLHMPTKYGYKQIKRIGLISYTNEKPDDYWTKLGYDWYAGL
ncbi:MAG TPA: molybdopterin-dependent oxidoreductase [Granulicella sp.]|jgi:hypothetical protein